LTASRPSPARRFLLALAMCTILGGLGGLTMANISGSDTQASSPRFIPPREQARDFHLRDQNGRVTSLESAHGRVIALTFIYTTCWDLCPAQAAEVMQAVKQVGKGVDFYAVSVDPVGDTPRNVDTWISARDWQREPFHYLTGTREQLEPVWSAYGIVPVNATPEEAAAAAEATMRFRKKAAEEGIDLASRPYAHPQRGAPSAALEANPDTGDMTYRGRARHAEGDQFEHSAYVMLIDRRGEQRLGIPFERLDPNTLAQDLRVLRDEPA
jgi:protein SCO1